MGHHQLRTLHYCLCSMQAGGAPTPTSAWCRRGPSPAFFAPCSRSSRSVPLKELLVRAHSVGSCVGSCLEYSIIRLLYCTCVLAFLAHPTVSNSSLFLRTCTHWWYCTRHTCPFTLFSTDCHFGLAHARGGGGRAHGPFIVVSCCSTYDITVMPLTCFVVVNQSSLFSAHT